MTTGLRLPRRQDAHRRARRFPQLIDMWDEAGHFLRRSETSRGYLLLLPMLLFVGLALIIPSVIIVLMSFWTQEGAGFDRSFTMTNYVQLVQNPGIHAVLFKSLAVAAVVAFLTVILSFPAAYFVAFCVKKNKIVWLIFITLPFWTSYLFRIFAWKIILGHGGVLNSGLMSIGIIDHPLEFMLYNTNAVVITLAHAWAAFAILPIYVSLEKIDRTLLEAAADLGEGPLMRFLRITLPLSMPGVVAAILIVFIPTVGDYATPQLVGGPTGTMIGMVIQSFFGRSFDWPMGAALAVLSLLATAIAVCAFLWLTRVLTRKVA